MRRAGIRGDARLRREDAILVRGMHLPADVRLQARLCGDACAPGRRAKALLARDAGTRQIRRRAEGEISVETRRRAGPGRTAAAALAALNRDDASPGPQVESRRGGLRAAHPMVPSRSALRAHHERRCVAPACARVEGLQLDAAGVMARISAQRFAILALLRV